MSCMCNLMVSYLKQNPSQYTVWSEDTTDRRMSGWVTVRELQYCQCNKISGEEPFKSGLDHATAICNKVEMSTLLKYLYRDIV